MPDLSQLTDYDPDVTIGGNGVPTRITVRPQEPDPALNDFNSSVGTKLDDILNKLTGANGQQRYQLWPEKVIRGGLAAAGDALAGNVPQWAVDKDTGEVHTSPQMIEKAQEISALAGTGGLAGADATLGSTAFLRPALKYKDKIYKGKEGQQHQDVIPKELYPEFEQMAMNGEDISHYNFGFMNHKGQFLDREKALEYAINEGLVDAHAGQYGALTSTLMADSSKPGVAIEAMAKANPFFSALEHNVNAIQQSKMTGEQWLGTLSNKPGVKPEELQWTGLGDFLKENGSKPVTKEQIQEHLASNKVELKEVNKGGKKQIDDVEKLAHEYMEANHPKVEANTREYDRLLEEKITKLENEQKQATKYHSYQLPGGENYREMLLTLPVKDKFKGLKVNEQGYIVDREGNFRGAKQPNETVDQALTREASRFTDNANNNYRSSHWDEPNILAHVRMNDRTIDGKKSLHLEEIQSDWHQQGRDKGYKGKDGDLTAQEKELKALNAKSWEDGTSLTTAEKKRQSELHDLVSQSLRAKASGVPDAPFKKSWHELVLKRMIREAAEKGYDRLSWTPGEAQAARYDLSKQIDKLAYDPKTGHLQGFKDGGMAMDNKVSKDKLADFVGKKAAEKLLNKPTKVLGNGYHTLENADLKIGGEGMKGFYDKMIPAALEKIGKEHGVKVKRGEIDAGKGKPTDYKDFADWEKAKADGRKEPIHYIDIPQSLKDQAMHKGFSLFSKGGHMLMPVDHEPDFGDDK